MSLQMYRILVQASYDIVEYSSRINKNGEADAKSIIELLKEESEKSDLQASILATIYFKDFIRMFKALIQRRLSGHGVNGPADVPDTIQKFHARLIELKEESHPNHNLFPHFEFVTVFTAQLVVDEATDAFFKAKDALLKAKSDEDAKLRAGCCA